MSGTALLLAALVLAVPVVAVGLFYRTLKASNLTLAQKLEVCEPFFKTMSLLVGVAAGAFALYQYVEQRESERGEDARQRAAQLAEEARKSKAAAYERAIEVVSALAAPPPASSPAAATDPSSDPNKLRLAFEVLYWGTLPYVGESDKVAGAMGAFRNALVATTNPESTDGRGAKLGDGVPAGNVGHRSQELPRLALALAQACREDMESTGRQ